MLRKAENVLLKTYFVEFDGLDKKDPCQKSSLFFWWMLNSICGDPLQTGQDTNFCVRKYVHSRIAAPVSAPTTPPAVRIPPRLIPDQPSVAQPRRKGLLPPWRPFAAPREPESRPARADPYDSAIGHLLIVLQKNWPRNRK